MPRFGCRRPLIPLGLISFLVLGAVQTSPAQRPGKTTTYRVKIVLRVEADTNTLSKISATCPIPVDWPEQQVKLVSETKTEGAKTREKTVAGMGALLVVDCPKLPRGQVLEVERIYELTRTPIVTKVIPPSLQRPAQVPKEFRDYLKASPGIETADKDLQKLAEQLGAGKKHPWEFTRDCSKWIRRNIRYKTGPYEGAKATLQKKTGDCENVSALLIALCRIAEIPARTVWVEGHTYPEFYLEDGDGHGHWIPVQLHAPEVFGNMSEYRPILQKGDHYRDPIAKKAVRYLPLQLFSVGGKAKFSVKNEILDQ